MPKETTETKLRKKREEFDRYYDTSSLDSPNDKNNLEVLLRNTVLIESIQEEMDKLAVNGIGENIQDIAKLNTALGNLIEKNTVIEKMLGIDRKSRRSETTKDNPAEYMAGLLASGQGFFEGKLQRVFCPDCQVMVMRYAPVHDHTAFDFRVQCSQCQKWVTATRKERDVFYDLKANDKEWRRAFPIQIVRPKKTTVDVEDDVTLGSADDIKDDV